MQIYKKQRSVTSKSTITLDAFQTQEPHCLLSLQAVNMKSNVILILGGLAATVLARTEIMLPLYAGPGGSTTSAEWNATIDAVRRNPDMHFYVVINPNNGPKNTSSPGNGGGCNVHTNEKPGDFDAYIEHGCNRDYSTNIAKLNALPNVQTVGYIYTRYGDQSNRSIAEIQEDIAEWYAAPLPFLTF